MIRLCVCDRRLTAEACGLFVPDVRGWYFPASPTRTMSKRARYYALSERAQYRHADMTGHPIRWHCCPYCGLDLPGLAEDGPPPPANFCSEDTD